LSRANSISTTVIRASIEDTLAIAANEIAFSVGAVERWDKPTTAGIRRLA